MQIYIRFFQTWFSCEFVGFRAGPVSRKFTRKPRLKPARIPGPIFLTVFSQASRTGPQAATPRHGGRSGHPGGPSYSENPANHLRQSAAPACAACSMTHRQGSHCRSSEWCSKRAEARFDSGERFRSTICFLVSGFQNDMCSNWPGKLFGI